MATAVLRPHDVLDNRMHQEAFGASPGSKPRRRRQSKPASAAFSSSPPKMYAVLSRAVPKRAASGSPAPKPAAGGSPPSKQVAAAGRRSPPARPLQARKQPSPTKEVRILKRGEEPPAPAPAPPSAPVRVPAKDRRVLSTTTSRTAAPQRSVMPAKTSTVSTNAATYAGPAFSAAAPEPSSLPFPAFFLRQAEDEATRGLRCLLRIGELP